MLSFDNAMTVNGQEAAASAGRIQAAPSKATTDGTCANGQARKHHHIWLVTGPAGCGKTTVAQYLAESLDMPYIEGDSVWPAHAP